MFVDIGGDRFAVTIEFEIHESLEALVLRRDDALRGPSDISCFLVH